MITMAHAHGKKGSLPRKGKHWSQRVREAIVVRSSDGSFNLKIDGGAENGEFIIIGGIKEDKVKFKKGKVLCDDIVLEINNQPVAGYTRPDVLTLINKNGGDAVSMRTVKPGRTHCLYTDANRIHCPISLKVEIFYILECNLIGCKVINIVDSS